MSPSAVPAGPAPDAPVTPGPWQEPVRGGHPSSALMGRSGLEQLQALLDGESDQPPLTHLTGMRLEQVRDGHARFSMPISPWLAGPDGAVGLGPLTIPTDAAMACAIIAGLRPHTGLTTTELSLRRLRAAPLGQRLTAEGRLVDWGDGVALADCSLVDETGALIARAESLCVTLPLAAEAAEPGAAPSPPAGAPAASPDPWQRPNAPAEGLAALTGLRVLAAHDGQAEVVLPASPWLCAPPPGRAQGGMVAVLAEAALSAAIDPGTERRFVTTELKVNYLRPLLTDGGLARARARLVHRGRRIAVASVEVVDARGRPVAIATGSALARGGDAA